MNLIILFMFLTTSAFLISEGLAGFPNINSTSFSPLSEDSTITIPIQPTNKIGRSIFEWETLFPLKLLKLAKVSLLIKSLLLLPKPFITVSVQVPPTTTEPPSPTTEPPTSTTEITPVSNSTPIDCPTDNDLFIMVDDSGSVGNHNFNIALNFTATLAVKFRENNGTRIGVGFFSVDAIKWVSLKESESLDNKLIETKILSAPYRRGYTESISEAINFATDQFLAELRVGVRKHLLLITDGQSPDVEMTITAARRFLSLGNATSFSVGIGDYVNTNQLLQITGAVPSHVFQVNDFPEIIELLRPVSSKVCGDNTTMVMS